LIAEADASESPVKNLIDEYIARGVFRAASLPRQRNGEAFRLVWFQNQEMMLEADERRSQARLLNVLPTVTSRSTLDRELRGWLRARSDQKLPAHRRLDPAEMQAKLVNRAGQMQLTMTSLKGDVFPAVRKLLHLTNELYLDFLSAPERYHWIVETFELDPDNPKWP